MGHKKAFSIIELLVVIGVIALLAAIIMPVLGKARQAGKSIVCRSNLKNMCEGANLYIQENNGRLMGHNLALTGLWLNAISDNLDDVEEVRFCPSTKVVDASAVANNNGKDGSAGTAWMWRFKMDDDEYGSYGMNG